MSMTSPVSKGTSLCCCFLRSPLNEDVFAAQTEGLFPVNYEEIKDLQAKIYKLFLQVTDKPQPSTLGLNRRRPVSAETYAITLFESTVPELSLR